MLRIILLIVTSVTVFNTNTLSYAQTAIGKAEQINTTVTGRSSRRIKSNANIFANERIRSNKTGIGHFKFTDGTKMVVGPGSNLLLDELIYNPSGSTFKKVVINSASGATRFITGKSKSSAFKIITPVGVLGLRGTAFDFRHFRGRTYLMLLDGRVEICSRTNTCRTLRRKCSFVVVGRDGTISRPVSPRRSIFQDRDMEQYFPFVNDQSQLNKGYQLRVRRCSGGRSTQDGEAADKAPAAPEPISITPTTTTEPEPVPM